VLLSEDGAGLATGVLTKLKVKMPSVSLSTMTWRCMGQQSSSSTDLISQWQYVLRLELRRILLLRRARGIRWIKLLDEPLRLSGRCCERKNFCPCQESNTGRPLTIVTELHRLYTLEWHVGIWGRH